MLDVGRTAGPQAQASAAVPALRGRPGSAAASLRGSPGSTTTLGSAAEEAPARGSYADLHSAHMNALPVRLLFSFLLEIPALKSAGQGQLRRPAQRLHGRPAGASAIQCSWSCPP